MRQNLAQGQVGVTLLKFAGPFLLASLLQALYGAADLFVGGRHVRGTWSRGTPQDRTVYRDDAGREVLLAPGKTWIALFPANAALIF